MVISRKMEQKDSFWESNLWPLSDLELDFLARKFQIKVHKYCKPLHFAYAYHFILLKFKYTGLREKGLAQLHYSVHHIEGYYLLCYKEKIYIPQSLRQRVQSWYHEYCCGLSMTFSDHLTWKTLMKILNNQKIIHLITSFNQLYGY
jgi:hypothetical protein